MKIRVFRIVLVLLTLALGVFDLCVPRPAYGADPTVNPVKLDNADARVLVVTSLPGAKSSLHEHKMNRVMIYLEAGRMTLTDVAGAIEKLNFKAGEALWSPATVRPHVSLNESDRPVRIIEVELKSPAGKPELVASTKTDWVRAGGKRCAVTIDNDQVRVVRVQFAPGAKGLRRLPTRNYLVAYLTDARVREKGRDGASQIVSRSAGEVVWGARGTLEGENSGARVLEMVVVEFKTPK